MIKPLTSLRFFFAFLVFISHLEWVPGFDKSFTSFYDNVLHEGFLGVSFFFILSGFVLALNYKEKILRKEVSHREFWVSRLARIYPLHLITLLYSLPIFLPDLLTAPSLWIRSFLANLFLVQSFVPSADIYFGFNAVSWSISNEIFYYLLFPLLIVLLYRVKRGLGLILVAIPLILLCIPLVKESDQIFMLSINPVVRLADFILGILLYQIYESTSNRSWIKNAGLATVMEIGAIALFGFFFYFHNSILVKYRFAVYYWIPMIGVIYIFAHEAGYLSQLMSRRILVFLGEISFSFYMLHALTMRYIKAVERRIDFHPDVYHLVIFIFIFTLLLSVLSYYFLELPANRSIKSWYRKKRSEDVEPLISEEQRPL